ncbi:MAG TPA: polyphosphate polymerase domain-containing protein [Aeromicrobium sp.]|nr:polyphosphate polymerase domain-containing protein [Aeromicrobium sp.]
MTIDVRESLPLDRLRPVDLLDVLARAELLERVDRKYMVPVGVAAAVMGELSADHHVLVVNGRRTTHYRTTYFDTDDRVCIRDHVMGRRRRFKARSRLYVEDGLCRLEVKTKHPRGRTIKAQIDMAPDSCGELTEAHHRFIEETLAHNGVPKPSPLRKSFEVTCCRATVVDLAGGVRITFDRDVTCSDGSQSVSLDPGHVIVETKGSMRATRADALLWRAGYRPRSFSKYAALGAVLDPTISDNGLRRLLGNQLHYQGATQ